MALISVSIDITGSTKLKRQFKKISKGNQNNINRLYREFARIINNREMDLYLELLRELKLDNLFVIKTLGDESWFVYDIDDMNTKTLQFNNIFHTIYRTLTHNISRYCDIPITPRELSPEEALNNAWVKSIKFEWPDIAVKAYMDLIKDYEEISVVRKNVFFTRSNDFFTLEELKLGDNFRSEKFQKLISNFNIGDFRDMIGNKVTISHRFDPIGLEVDLFFRCRCTKYVYPGIIGIGRNLFQNLYGVRIEDIKPNKPIRNYRIDDHNYDCLHCVEIKKIKGTGGNYNIYYLINSNDLHGDIRLRIKPSIYKKTIKFLNEIKFWENDSTVD